ncbi:MAG: ankyrin repeat domain-containing protein [Planctomycetota bacterium]
MEFSRRNVLRCLPAAWIGLACVRSGHPRAPHDDAQEFLAAVRAGDESEVRRQLSARPDLAAARDAAGVSALLHAHLSGHPAIAAILRSQGLELDIAECVFEKDWARMEELAQRDPALPNELHPIGGNLLYAGVLADSGQLFRIRSLGCDRDGAPRGGSGFTPARIAMDHRTLSGAVIAATELLGNGSDPNARQKGGDSVLHGAVRRRSERLVRLAVRKGAAVEARDDAGRTGLALARELGWSEGVALLENPSKLPRDHRASRFLLDANREPVRRPDLADVPQETQNQITGSSHAKLERLRELVGEDRRLVFSVSTDDELAIEASAHVGNREIMRFHLDRGAPMSLPTAVSMGDTAMARFLLDRDPLLVNERGAHDFALMHYAAIGGAGVEMAALLHERGAAIDQETQGMTTLHWSVRKKMAELTKWLVEKGADVEAVGTVFERAGQTPMQMALAGEDRRQIEILRAAGAKG